MIVLKVADAIKVLMKSYMGERRSSKVVFDYSDIRAKGALLVTSGGKAPGPQPLKECIVKITGILDSKEDGDQHYIRDTRYCLPYSRRSFSWWDTTSCFN